MKNRNDKRTTYSYRYNKFVKKNVRRRFDSHVRQHNGSFT